MQKPPGFIYFVAFLITAAIFTTAYFITESIASARLDELSGLEDRVSIDILSLETQFDLLADQACEAAAEGTAFSAEIPSLGDRLSRTEARLGSDDPQVATLKQQYSLLEIKEYLLLKRIALECRTKPVAVLYFYSNSGDCENCDRAGYALESLREEFPDMHVYSFDYDLSLGALKTLTMVLKVKRELPAFVIDGKTYYDFESLDAIRSLLPKRLLDTASSTKTTSP